MSTEPVATQRAWRGPAADAAALGVDAEVLERMVEELERASAKLFRGAQMALFRDGVCVLEAGVGRARERTEIPVTPETLFVLFSATKGLTALAMLQLYERGALHYDEPVVKYWPEFASHLPEKRSITLRHVLGHRGGFPTGPSWLTTRHFGDREALRRAMIEVPLSFVPGERNHYHPMNFGHVLNEIIERVDGRDCGRFLREEVFDPLGIDDLHLGLPDDEALEQRVAWCYNDLAEVEEGRAGGFNPSASAGTAPLPDPEREEKIRRRFGDTPELAHGFNRPETHRAVLPAAGAIGTARALAEVYAMLSLDGSRDGVELVHPWGLDQATAPSNRPGDVDGLIGMPMRWAAGFHVGMHGGGSTLRTFGHAGAGGQVGFADRERRLAFAFVTNGELDPGFYVWRYKLQTLAFKSVSSAG